MSVVQIPNLASATSLGGSEQLEAVQSGSSVRLTVTQIGAYINSQYPAPGITSVTATSPLTSSTVSGAVTISLPSQSITNAYLATMAANTVKANLSGSASTPTDVSPSAILDTFGTQVGSILYRGSSGWTALTSGTNAQVLTANGTTSPPSWTSLGLGTMAYQNANAVAITGGTIGGVAISTSTINQTTIGATTPSTGAFTTLSANSTASFATISSGVWQGTAVAVAYGGTGATTAAGARTNLGAAASGANADITSLTGLTTPLSETQGGTGYGSYTTGDILYANSSTTLARLNDVATGNALISGGVGVAPSWGKIGLSTHVSGTLPVSSGGTGATTLTGYLVGNGTSAVTAVSTIPNAGLTNSSITIGSTAIALGSTSTTLAGLVTVTLTQDPTAALQASTKQYVDNQVLTVSNTTFHAASSYATTAALSATYANGTGGVGATLTNSAALAALTIDGYTFTATDVTNSTRVLIKDQASGLQNGIYTVTNQGSGAAAWVLTRAADFNTVGTGPNYIETGASTFVTSGSVNASTGWVMNTSGTITVGTTALTWAQTSSSSSVTVTSPLTKVGSVISLGTVTVPFGGTGLTTLTAYSVMIGNGTGNVAFATPSTTGYALLSTGASSNPSFGQLSLTAGVTGTLPVANGGTGTATALTAGSVVFAGASGTYSQNNTKFFWDNTNNRLGINTGSPQTQLTIVSNTQTTTPTGTLPSGTDIYIVGANAANTRITQDAYGTGAYGVYTARSARGTAASPTASQSGDFLTQFTGRGYGATGFATASTGYFSIAAAENFTDTAQGTYASIFTTAIGANSPTEAFRFGTAGQLGIGGATYGTSGYVLTSGGASAAPTWSQVSATSLSGILPVANGGTGLASWTTGSLVYASGTTTLAGLADVATGNVLLSGGVGVAPAWGQVSLTTAVTGTLPIANGGTGLTSTPANGALDIGNGAGFTRTTLTQGTNIAITNGAGSISIATSATPSFATSVTTPLVIGGTAASSSLTLQSTSGVGTSDSILFKVGNNGATTAMTIDTSGNVGIGTSSPAAKLDIGSGNLNFSSTAQRITGDMSSATLGNRLGFQSSVTNGNTNFYVIPNGSATTAGVTYFNSSSISNSSYGGITITSTVVSFNSGQLGTGTFLPMAFFTGGSEQMRLDSSGNVGIGTSSPSYLLHLNQNGNTQAWISATNVGSNSAGIGFENAGQRNWQIWADRTNDALQFGNNSRATVNMVINSSGNVGIGTSSPSNALSVARSSGEAVISITNSGTASSWLTLAPGSAGVAYIHNTGNTSTVFTTNGTERFRIGPSGQWGIGGATYGTSGYAFVSGGASAAPTWSQVSLTAGVTGTLPVANGGTGVTTSTGTGSVVLSASPTFTGTLAAATITATGSITAYFSDDRLKTRKGNIQNALAKVETLNGFHYEANETAQDLGYEAKPEIGVSAQEVQAVLPEVVVPAPIDEKYLTIHYDRMVPLLIEAIKELSAKVKELESKQCL